MLGRKSERMASQAIRRLIEAIGYPEGVPEGEGVVVLRVDGERVRVAELGGQLVLSKVLDRAEEDLGALAGFAVGRMLREEAVLAWDAREEAVILWQGVPVGMGAEGLRLFFEAFMDSCDWWQERATALHAPPPAFPQMVIHP